MPMETLRKNIDYVEMLSNANLTYVLEPDSPVLATEYKVLQSQAKAGDHFVKCMCMLFNGKPQLYYLIDGGKPLSSELPKLNPNTFLTLLSSLVKNIIDVKDNGFLSCLSIDISFDHVYLDPVSSDVRLVYLPVERRLFRDYSAFQSALCANIIEPIRCIQAFSVPCILQLLAELNKSPKSLEDLYIAITEAKMSSAAPSAGGKDSRVKPSPSTLRLVALNAPSQFEIAVNQDEFLLGRNPALTNCAISFNKLIGRLHCKLLRSMGQYLVEDLNSTNGTFVNSVRLLPNQPCSIQNGDTLRLATSEFQVIIEQGGGR